LHFRTYAQSARLAEGDLAISKFFSTTITVQQFRDIAKVMLVLLNEAFIAGHGPREPRVILIPHPDEEAIGANMQGRALILEAEARRSSEPSDVILRDIENQAYANHLGDSSLAGWIVAQWFSGEMEGWSSLDQTATSCDRWRGRFPEDSTLALNSAGMAIRQDDLAKAESEIHRAEELDAPNHMVHRLRGSSPSWPSTTTGELLVASSERLCVGSGEIATQPLASTDGPFMPIVRHFAATHLGFLLRSALGWYAAGDGCFQRGHRAGGPGSGRFCTSSRARSDRRSMCGSGLSLKTHTWPHGWHVTH
jgi:hypothetical protein